MQPPADFNYAINRLFAHMDQAYDQTARATRFACCGCEQNCCQTRFHHHTLLEYEYLQSGVGQLSAQQQALVRRRAREAVEQTRKLERRNEPAGVMCPLNMDGICGLYAWRPMICRLHGVPHLVRLPDGSIKKGRGCDDFYAQCKKGPLHELDRTPLYLEMADLERRLRRHRGVKRKTKMTIAEMLVNEIH